MTAQTRRPGRLNVKALLILALASIAVLVGGLIFHTARKKTMARRARAEGEAAYVSQNWVEASKKFRHYLGEFPEDEDALLKVAKSDLNVRPVDPRRFSRALNAYRRLFEKRPDDVEVLASLARLYLQFKEFDELIYICNRWLELDENAAEATTLLARAMIAQNKAPEAESLLTDLVAQRPTEVTAYQLLAGIAHRRLEDDRALDWLNRCVQNNPEDAGSLTERARYYLSAWPYAGAVPRDVDKARDDIEATEALGSDDPRVGLFLAESWAQLGDKQKAYADLDRFKSVATETIEKYELDANVVTAEWYRIAAGLALSFGTRDEMVAVAEEALANVHDSLRVAFLPHAIRLFLASRRFEQARSLVEELSEKTTGSPTPSDLGGDELHILRSRLAYLEGRYYEVIAWLTPVVNRTPNSSQAWRLIAQACVATDQHRQALRALESYVELQPDDDTAKTQLVREHLRQGQWEQAMRDARTIGHPTLETKLLLIEAQLRRAMRNPLTPDRVWEDLAQQLADARQEHPDVAEIRMLQAAIEAQTGHTDDAVAELRQAIAECTDSLEPALRLAALLRQQGHVDEALKVCADAAEANSDDAHAFIALAEFQLAAHHNDDTRKTLESARKRFDGDAGREVTTALARFHLSQGDQQEGIRLLNEVIADPRSGVWPRVALLETDEVAKDETKARKLVEELKALEGESAGLYWRFLQARSRMLRPGWQADAAQVTKLLSDCIQLDPTWGRPALLLGRAYEDLRRPQDAENVYRDALLVNPGSLQLVARLLSLLESQSRHAEARDVLERVPASREAETLLSHYRVGIALATEEYDAAINELETRSQSDAGDANARVLLARLVYHERRDTERAFRYLDEADAIDPDSLAAAQVRALILQSEGKKDDARAIVDRIVDRRKDFASHVFRARFLASTGDSQAAERDFEHLLELEPASPLGYQLLGEFYLINGNRREQAIDTWQRGLAAAPDDRNLQTSLMQALMSSDDPEEIARGEQLLGNLVEEFPGDPLLLRTKARRVLAKPDRSTADVRAAADLLEKAVARNPHDVASQLALIKIAYERRDLETAASRVLQALGANPQNPDLLVAGAEIARDRNRVTLANDYAMQVVNIGSRKLPPNHPKRVAAMLLLANLAADGKRFDDAKKWIDRAIDAAPDDVIVRVRQAAILELQGQTEQALKELSEFADTGAGRESLITALAIADLNCRVADEHTFEQSLDRARQLGAADGAVFRLRARCLAAKNQYEALEPALSKYQADHPDDVAPMYYVAGLLASTGVDVHQKAAAGIFEAIVQRNPKDLEGLLGLARNAYAMGDFQKSADVYQQVLAIDPDLEQALNDCAWILAEQGSDLENALTLASRALANNPSNPHILDTRGVVLTKLGRYDEAVSDLKSCVSFAADLPGTQARAKIHVADAFVAMGDERAARSALRQAKSLDDRYQVLTPAERQDLTRRLAEM